MHYFPLLGFQTTVLLVFSGLIFTIILYIAFYCQAIEKDENCLEEFPEGIKEKNGRVPPVLTILYLCFAFWAISYVIIVGILGPAF
jgi:hypothetical protein